ncbi:hypothetical protein [Pseudomonas putida]
MNNYQKQAKCYILLAVLLSSITAISLSFAIFNLISDPFLAVVFSAAAIGLDVFKYASWPLVIKLFKAKKNLLAVSISACAVILAVVSGWATYDRMHASIVGDHESVKAMKGERLIFLREQIKSDTDFLENIQQNKVIDTTSPQRLILKDLYKQASDMRARGMVTKAAEFESTTVARAEKRLAEIVTLDAMATERANNHERNKSVEARARIDKNSLEILDIESLVEKGSSVPTVFIFLICAGFAIGLEVFPSLIIAALVSLKASPEAQNHAGAEVLQDEQVVIEMVPQSSIEAVDEAPAVIRGVEDELLMKQLLDSIEPLKSGDPIKIKDFAAAAKIGTMRACGLFKLVAEAGLIEKTGNGYKKSLLISKKGVASA